LLLSKFIAFILSISQAVIKRYDAPTVSYSLALFNLFQSITSAIYAYILYNIHDEIPRPTNPTDHTPLVYWIEVFVAIASGILVGLYVALGSIDSSNKVEFAKGGRVRFADLV
jgi:hypothetical protein